MVLLVTWLYVASLLLVLGCRVSSSTSSSLAAISFTVGTGAVETTGG